MGGCKHNHLINGAGHYPPHVAYPYPYPNHGHPYPPPVGYPPAGYPPPAPCNPVHGGHRHGVGAFLAGGVVAMAGAYGGHHGYGYHHHHHHGKFKHYKFKRAKFGKRWKH